MCFPCNDPLIRAHSEPLPKSRAATGAVGFRVYVRDNTVIFDGPGSDAILGRPFWQQLANIEPVRFLGVPGPSSCQHSIVCDVWSVTMTKKSLTSRQCQRKFGPYLAVPIIHLVGSFHQAMSHSWVGSNDCFISMGANKSASPTRHRTGRREILFGVFAEVEMADRVPEPETGPAPPDAGVVPDRSIWR